MHEEETGWAVNHMHRAVNRTVDRLASKIQQNIAFISGAGNCTSSRPRKEPVDRTAIFGNLELFSKFYFELDSDSNWVPFNWLSHLAI